MGVPLFPVGAPGAAVSPGMSSCNLAQVPTFTVMAGLVQEVLLPSVVSVAVTVQLPAVLLVRLKVRVPEARAVLGGSTRLGSVVLMFTVSVTLPTRFQFASTAF